jgi:hypothetical protein
MGRTGFFVGLSTLLKATFRHPEAIEKRSFCQSLVPKQLGNREERRKK